MRLQRTIVPWIVLISIYNTVTAIHIQYPVICVRENLNIGKRELIDTTANDFKNFVRNSDIFVDKSSLLNLITQNSSFVLLAYPKKWGKSINLNMMKTFLELEVDYNGKAMPRKTTWSYRFFKKGEIMYENGTTAKLKNPPMFSKNERVMKPYLGKYPVIYLDLSSYSPASRDFEGFFKSFQKCIAAAFEMHGYMINVFRDQLDDCDSNICDKQSVKNCLAKFKAYKGQTMNSREDMIGSLAFLSVILKSHFNRQVYVMIDDYDVVIKKSYLEPPSPTDDEIEKIVEFYANFFSNTFGTKNTVQMGIVTGVLSVDTFVNRLANFSLINYNILNKNTPPFYGFTTNEVKQLLQLCFIDHMLAKKVIDYYSGYHLGDFLDIVVYSPQSMVNFVNKRKLGNITRSTAEANISSLILRCKEMRDRLDTVILTGKNFIDFHLRDLTFQKEGLTLLKTFMNNDKLQSTNPKFVDSFFTYLYALGYLTLGIQTDFYGEVANVKIELARGMEDVIETYLSALEMETTSHAVEGIVKLLLQFFHYKEYKSLDCTENETEKLCEFHKTRKSILPGPSPVGFQKFHALHLLVLRYMKKNFNYTIAFNVKYYDGDEVLRPYIVLEKSDHRAIIEFNYSKQHLSEDGLTRIALNRAKKFNAIFKDKPSVKTSFVGIGMIGSASLKSSVQIDTNPYYE